MLVRRVVALLLCLGLLGAWTFGQPYRAITYNGDDYALGQALNDSANTTTWFAWASVDGSTTGSTRHISVRTNNYSNGTWSAKYDIAANPNVDAHGSPAIVKDQYGYVHAVFGSHVSNAKYSYTTNSNDPSAWTAGSDIVCGCTFYQLVKVGTDIWLITDNNGNGHQDLYLFKGTPQSGGGVNSWTGVTYLTNCGNFACWMGNAIVSGTKICLPFYYTDDVVFDDAYYGCYDTSNGSFSNVDGSHVITSGNLPISRGTAQADFAVFLSPSSSYTGFGASQIVDGSGTLHIFYANGLASGSSFPIYETHWTGSAWSTGVAIATLGNLYGAVFATSAADGGFDVWWPNVTTQLADIYTTHYNPSTGFNSASLFFKATNYNILQVSPGLNSISNAPTNQILFGEVQAPIYANPQPITNPLARFWAYDSVLGFLYP